MALAGPFPLSDPLLAKAKASDEGLVPMTAAASCLLSRQWVVVVVSQFNGKSTPKGSYSAKTGDNNCNVNLSRYSLSTELCESNSLSGQV